MALVVSLAGCTTATQPVDVSAGPTGVVSSGSPTDDVPNDLPTGIITENGTTVEPAPPDNFNPSDYPSEDGIPLPTVEPQPTISFCQVYTEYRALNGPYSIAEAGEKLPAFTDTDRDQYAKLQASAPDEIKSLVDRLVSYGQEMHSGNFNHAVDYENLLSGPGGLIPFVVALCGQDAE